MAKQDINKFFLEQISDQQVLGMMDYLAKYKDTIKQTMLFDVTTLYFESLKEDDMHELDFNFLK